MLPFARRHLHPSRRKPHLLSTLFALLPALIFLAALSFLPAFSPTSFLEPHLLRDHPFQRYLSWHSRHARCLHTDNHFACAAAPRPPVLVWHCPLHHRAACAGVGDRLRGIQVAFILAVLTNRLLLIHWPSYPAPLSTVVQPHLLDWRVPAAVVANLTHSHMPHLNWFTCVPPRPCRAGAAVPHNEHLPNVRDSLPDINIYTDDIAARLATSRDLAISVRIPSQTVVHILRNRHVAAAFPQLARFATHDMAIHRHIMQLLFTPSDTVRAVIHATLPASFQTTHSYISIHARTGHDVNEATDRRFVALNAHLPSTVDALLTCAQRMHAQRPPRSPLPSPPPPLRIFLATDSMPLKAEFSRQAAAQRRGPVHVRFIREAALHVGLLGDVRTGARAATRRREVTRLQTAEGTRAFVNVFADLFMLAAGRVLLTTGSGFANAAFTLGNASAMVVVRPSNGTAQCVL